MELMDEPQPAIKCDSDYLSTRFTRCCAKVKSVRRPPQVPQLVQKKVDAGPGFSGWW
ncbi:hypothetical protein AHIS1636_11240 [Arthrobacter mangrovi]|uniref:Uncharacterized protein n=1 Tax=Arthrobacter mangrovi TaxID=2966350 RepID=A0ABQ5MSF9_9MICC|nr:hypothetical protein AHIS1636_11240 [Arthrobacter mangrovi]